jgi:hypothetical protein
MQRMIFAVAVIAAGCGGGSGEGRGTHAAMSPHGDSDAVTDQGPGPDTVCVDETPTGSSIPRRVCRSKMQSDMDRKGGQDFVRPTAKPTANH